MPESISKSAAKGMAAFLEERYITPQLHASKIVSFSKGSDQGPTQELTWVAKSRSGGGADASDLLVRVHLGIGPEGVVIGFPSDVTGASQPEEARISDEVGAVATTYLAKSRKSSLYFVFSTGADEKLEAQTSKSLGRDIRKKIFAGNNVNLFLILLAVSFVLAISLGTVAIFAIIGAQVAILFFSDRMMLGSGGVRPTRDHQDVTIVRAATTPSTRALVAAGGERVLSPVRQAIAAELSSKPPDDPRTAAAVRDVLVSHRVPCEAEDIKVVTKNPYQVVEYVAEKFHMKPPKIVIVNTPIENASATGISSGRSSITITAGALEDLNDEELKSVVGHEMGHVKGHDPLILFAATMVMYVGGLYLWLPLLLDLGLFYFIIAFAAIYALGKVLETRADTQSAAYLGNAGVLASALTHIGYAELFYERYSKPARVMDWLRFDPHPPTYFRVNRLAALGARGGKVRHALILSIRDCASGFLLALAGRAS